MSRIENRHKTFSAEKIQNRLLQLEQLSHLQQEFKIINPNKYIRHLVIDKCWGVNENFIEYQFHSKDKDWYIRFPQKLIQPTSLSPEGIYLNGFSEYLNDQQDFNHYLSNDGTIPKKSGRKKMYDHDMGPLFFSANWNVLSGMFYKSGINKRNNFQTFTEVNINEYSEFGFPDDKTGKMRKCWGGQADFVGIADHIFVIEFGAMSSEVKWRKSTQVKRQARGLTHLWNVQEPEKTHPLTNIIPLTAKYSHNEDTSRITLLPTSFPHDPKTKELFPIHLPEEQIIYSAAD